MNARTLLFLCAFYMQVLYCPVAQTMQPLNPPPAVDQVNAPVATIPSSQGAQRPITPPANPQSIPAEDIELLDFIKTARKDPRFSQLLDAAKTGQELPASTVDQLANLIREKRTASETDLIEFIREVVAETTRVGALPPLDLEGISPAQREQMLQDLAARTAQQQDQRIPGVGPLRKEVMNPGSPVSPGVGCVNCKRGAYVNPEFQPEFPIYTKAPIQLWDVTIVNKTGVTILAVDEVIHTTGNSGTKLDANGIPMLDANGNPIVTINPRILYAAKTLDQGQQYVFHWYNQYTPPVGRRIKISATCQGATGAMNTISIGTTPDCTYQAIPSGTYYIIRPAACRLCIADAVNNTYCQ